MRIAIKSFLKRNIIINNHIYYSLFNPSIADYILGEYKNDSKKLILIFKALNTVKSLEYLSSLLGGKIISLKLYNTILKEVSNDAFIQETDFNYLIFISYLVQNQKNKKNDILTLIKNISNNPQPINQFSKFSELLCIFKNDLEILNFDFLIEIRENRGFREDEIVNLLKLLDLYEIEDENIYIDFKYDIENYLNDKMLDIQDDIDFDEHSFPSYDEEGTPTKEIDEDSIKEEIKDKFNDLIIKMGSKSFDKFEIDVDYICDVVDVNGMYDDFLASRYDDFLLDNNKSNFVDSVNHDPIDDLFERT